jgi:uncharacterized secreted protein with C-terminal beta-propeller domain
MPLKTISKGNSTFVIGDHMKKVHMDKNKLLVSYVNTKIICPFPMCFDNDYEKC